ncbi:GNAT family N-acetyltransferase [Planomicrobium sp. YIM 101495]|uniref:GNAT family N-acetyltransferase n=1 Tax=Planomicrobium sp. YIM 101495 TaxID=2665160 RepID=UPI0018A9DB09|nr:GNAT family N-acetyltransferase [Planomicrobium sp. YIM 101495]
MKYEIQPLDWDSNYFGVSAAKVIINEELREKDFQEIKSQVRDFEFVVINNMDNAVENNHLIGLYSNAFLVDMNVQFEMEMKPAHSPSFYKVKNQYEKNEEILEIAKNAFNYSRFYNDPFLDGNLSRDIYFNWVNNSFEKAEKFFIVAEEGGQIFGFILFSIKNSKELVIELISLAPASQGKGIGTKLISTVKHYAENNSLHKIKVGTQIDNLQAMNFYAKKGFDFCSKASIYHYWPRKELSND